MDNRMRLEHVESDSEITEERCGAFLFLYRQAILLALKEGGVFTEGQLRRGEELLRRRYGAALPDGEGDL